MLDGEGSSRTAEQERVKELSPAVCTVGFLADQEQDESLARTAR